MEQLDLLRYAVEVIECVGVRYFVTGSTATILYGEPRFTNDIDLVVDLTENHVSDFCQRFPPEEFYVSEPAARAAVLSKSQFNIIHPASGLKLDIIVPAPNAFNESRFRRSKRLPAGEAHDALFASPEDVIIEKMEYYREGGSEKHLRDIAGVMKALGDKLDRNYITDWSRQLNLGDIWEAIQNQPRLEC